MPFVLQLNELILTNQFVNDRPINPCTRQKVAHSLFPHGMYGGDTQQVFLDVTRESERIALVPYQIFHMVNTFMENIIRSVDRFL